jgi:hypothetical protein
MGLEDNKKTAQEREASKINELHFLLFLIHFCIVLIMILLLIIGRGSYCCTLIFIFLLLLNISFYWHRRRINRFKDEKLAWESRTTLEVINLPKVYDYYCPRCLYQTNEDVEYCPNCKVGRLSPTTKGVN